jgi:hypothetical protein
VVGSWLLIVVQQGRSQNRRNEVSKRNSANRSSYRFGKFRPSGNGIMFVVSTVG